MEPTAPSRQLPVRVDDYRVRPYAEAKSWAPIDADEPSVQPREAARIYTHNAERFAPREPVVTESVDEDVEPSVPQPPHWMLLVAGAAIAALMGALLGGFMQV